jgi:hypothetical protein
MEAEVVPGHTAFRAVKSSALSKTTKHGVAGREHSVRSTDTNTEIVDGNLGKQGNWPYHPEGTDGMKKRGI